MLKKAPEKLFTSESHRPFLVVILVIPPTEADLGFGNGEKPMVRDGDTMGITRQVLQDVIRPTEWRLGIHNPILLKQRSQESIEVALICQRQTLTEKR